MKNFALTGVGGGIAPRHLRAIRDTGSRLVAALDPSDSVGVLDQFAPAAAFFTETERFDRHLEKLRRGPAGGGVDYLAVCSPNYLHDAHCRMGLRLGADVICEKPLVINPWNIAPLQELEAETGRRIYNVLQLRLHPALTRVRDEIVNRSPTRAYDVTLTYVASRGAWYDVSWKGDIQKSGGISTNIGIHLFDLLVWLFGAPEATRVHLSDKRRMAGFLALERARVRWFLSVDAGDLPVDASRGERTTFRAISIDGREVEFSDRFADLHTRVYEGVLAGRGHGINAVRASIELAHAIRVAPLSPVDADAHPLLRTRR